MEDLIKQIESKCNETQKIIFKGREQKERLEHNKEVQLLFKCIEEIRILCNKELK